jgi:hypothetical protein
LGFRRFFPCHGWAAYPKVGFEEASAQFLEARLGPMSGLPTNCTEAPKRVSRILKTINSVPKPRLRRV